MKAPGAEDRRTLIRKQLGRFGLDFVVAGLAFLNRQLGKWHRNGAENCRNGRKVCLLSTRCSHINFVSCIDLLAQM